MEYMPDPTSTMSLGVLIKHGGLAVLGGLAHAINAHRRGESKGFIDFVLLMVLSSFFGILFGFIALSVVGANEYITMSLAGIGGWLGVESTGLLIDFTKRVLGLPSDKLK